jgi:tryptophan synthase beta chain
MENLYNDYFGRFGGRYVAEMLRTPLDDLERGWKEAMASEEYTRELERLLTTYAGRPTPLVFAENATRRLGGARIYIKLEGLANTGAHKINNALGQALLAQRMGKTRVIAETGAGQHGVATAAACAKLGLNCRVYMGAVDVARQRPNVFWMELLGGEVVPVHTGSQTLKDAINEALRDWAASFETTHYLIGSALGPSPYPDMVREYQCVIGREVAEEIQARGLEVEALIACVGGGSNAIGFFSPFIGRPSPRLIGVEAGGRSHKPGEHAARMGGLGKTGIVHGYKSLFLLNDDGQVGKTHSISAGLDYPGIGPQLAHLGEQGRVEFTTVQDSQALEAVRFFAAHEGLIFALESAHGAAEAIRMAPTLPNDRCIVLHMSGRGDKDLFILAGLLDRERWSHFLRKEGCAGEPSFDDSPGGVLSR